MHVFHAQSQSVVFHLSAHHFLVETKVHINQTVLCHSRVVGCKQAVCRTGFHFEIIHRCGHLVIRTQHCRRRANPERQYGRTRIYKFLLFYSNNFQLVHIHIGSVQRHRHEVHRSDDFAENVGCRQREGLIGVGVCLGGIHRHVQGDKAIALHHVNIILYLDSRINWCSIQTQVPLLIHRQFHIVGYKCGHVEACNRLGGIRAHLIHQSVFLII